MTRPNCGDCGLVERKKRQSVMKNVVILKRHGDRSDRNFKSNGEEQHFGEQRNKGKRQKW